MPYPDLASLPEAVRRVLPQRAQQIWRAAWNAAYKQYGSEESATRVAWAAVKRAGYRRGSDGMWHKDAWARAMQVLERWEQE